MTIHFVPEDYQPKNQVTPSIKFGNDAMIYIDHIPVAYFSVDHGGIVALPFETGPDLCDDDALAVKYLQDRGFKFKEKVNDRGPDYSDYYITLASGSLPNIL